MALLDNFVDSDSEESTSDDDTTSVGSTSSEESSDSTSCQLASLIEAMFASREDYFVFTTYRRYMVTNQADGTVIPLQVTPISAAELHRFCLEVDILNQLLH